MTHLRSVAYRLFLRVVCPLAPLVILICLTTGCRGKSPLEQPRLNHDEAMELLVDAEGFASVYNVEKVEQICNHVLSTTDAPGVQARALWVWAAAYGHFQVEYRNRRYEEQRQAILTELAKLNRESIAYEITHQNVAMLFCCPGPQTLLEANGIVERERLAAKLSSDPLDLYRFGMVCFQAGLYCNRIDDPERADIYFRESVENLYKLVKQKPDFYEGRAYYITLLARVGRYEDARLEAERLVDAAGLKLPYPPFNDQGPFCLRVAAVGNLSRRSALEMLQKHIDEGGKDPWAHFVKAMNDVEITRGIKDQVQVFASLAKKLEKGTLSTRGTHLKVLASTYYQLASRQIQADDLDGATETYAKLAEISPHYAQIHQNQAIILTAMARKENDEVKRKALLDEALGLLRLQAEYDWHGKGAAEARAMIGMLGA